MFFGVDKIAAFMVADKALYSLHANYVTPHMPVVGFKLDSIKCRVEHAV